MSYCNDLCEQRDASIKQTSGIDNMVQLGTVHVALGLFLNQFKVDMLHNTDMLLECMYDEVCCCNPSSYLILKNK